MDETHEYEDLVAKQRKERKDLIALTQKKKHSVTKADKKKKKEVNNEIAQMLADLDLKHEEELRQFQEQFPNVEIEYLQLELSTEESTANSSSYSESTEAESPANIVLENVPGINNAQKRSPISDSTDSQSSVRISKAQKRRNRKTEQAKEREKAIQEQEVINMSGVRSLEMADIAKKLAQRDLMIHEIPSDGDCLYNAIEHQLSILNLERISMKSLRSLTANYLRSHKEEYIPFLEHPVNGDIISEEQFEKYCNDVANTSTWGGHVEVQVLSNVCGRPIEIIQAEGPSIIIGNEHDNLKLIISYHRHAYGLGAHYNSVIPKKEVIE